MNSGQQNIRTRKRPGESCFGERRAEDVAGVEQRHPRRAEAEQAAGGEQVPVLRGVVREAKSRSRIAGD